MIFIIKVVGGSFLVLKMFEVGGLVGIGNFYFVK